MNELDVKYKLYEIYNSNNINELKSNKELVAFLREKYSDNAMALSECLYRYVNNLKECPKCEYCKCNDVKFLSLTRGYRQYCSVKCMANSPKTKQSIIRTSLQRYGVSNGGGSKEALKKIKRTNLERRGVTCPLKDNTIQQKIKQTVIKKYGVDNPTKNKEVIERIKKTCLQKYGSTSFLNSDYCNEIRNNKEIQDKIQETKRKNHTFNTSKPEEELYLYIKEKFPLVKRQYKDSIRYPFACDFYIPELDLFLELNANWTHGKHSFSSTNANDLYIIECWKKKVEEGHLYYANAIKTWTIYDVKKRNKAKEENLNYKEVWTLEEGKKFIDSL